MRMNLLSIVQDILSSMGSDEVNSIADTTESLGVANIVRNNYHEIIGEIQPKEVESIFHLDASTDDTKPCVMYLPDNVMDIQELKYNVGDSVIDTNFRTLCYVPIAEFLEYMNGLDIDEDWVDSQEISLNGQTFNIKHRNDESPHRYTTIDDRVFLFDSYDKTYEETLTSSRTYGIGNIIPVFQMSDSYVPDLDPRHFTLLLNAAKAQAWAEIKQTTNEKAERKERRGKIVAYKSKSSTDTRKPLHRRKGFGR